MAVVTFNGIEHECSKAIKGADYIHLVDDNGVMVASFEGIVNFDAFTISGGTWTEPLDYGDCTIAVFQNDGKVVPGGHKCKDIAASSVYTCTLSSNATVGWEVTATGYTRRVPIKDLTEDYLILIISSSDYVWLQNFVSMHIATGYLVFDATCLPSEDATVTFSATLLIASTVIN